MGQPIPNQIFVGLPWRRVKPKYDRCIAKLHRSFPIYFHVVGNRDSQDAEDLLQRIKQAIDSSSYAIFDATGGNANVALEFGYAEAVSRSRALYLSDHKRSAPSGQASIISDLAGKKQNRYKNESQLYELLYKLAKGHAFAVQYDRALRKLTKGKSKAETKRIKTASLKVIRVLDGRQTCRRIDVVEALDMAGLTTAQINRTLKGLRKHKIIRVTAGRFSVVRLA